MTMAFNLDSNLNVCSPLLSLSLSFSIFLYFLALFPFVRIRGSSIVLRHRLSSSINAIFNANTLKQVQTCSLLMGVCNAFLGTFRFVVFFVVFAVILPQNMCCIMILLRFIKIYSTITFHYYSTYICRFIFITFTRASKCLLFS